MSGYLDASTLLAALVEEQASARVDQFIQGGASPFTVSEFAAAETASGLSRRARAGALTLEAAAGRLAQFDVWRAASTRDIAVCDADFRLASLFVRRFDLGLRAPDALHAALCRRAGLTLITLDMRLARAGAALGIEVVVP